MKKIGIECPYCGLKNQFILDDFEVIRLGEPGAYTGTGGVPMVRCPGCNPRTTFIEIPADCYPKWAEGRPGENIAAPEFGRSDRKCKYVNDVSYPECNFVRAR